MAAPILWAPRISVFFLQKKNLHVHEICHFRGGGILGLVGAGIFLKDPCETNASRLRDSPTILQHPDFGAIQSIREPAPAAQTSFRLVTHGAMPTYLQPKWLL